jgi:putative oxidoreductase
MISSPFSNMNRAEWPSALGLLGLRVWLAQEFFLAGWRKIGGGQWQAPDWFAGLSFPFPVSLLPANLNWVLAGGGEVLLALVLLAGFYGRLAALGLLFITWVAVSSVHFDLGWAGWNQIDTEDGQGFKLPLMIAVMLLALAGQGMGKWSLDAWRSAHGVAGRRGQQAENQ